jgi:hypothetical protein
MKFKDRVIQQLDTTQNRLDNIIRMIESNAPISKEQLLSELKSYSRIIEYVSETVGLEDNDFSSLEGKSR